MTPYDPRPVSEGGNRKMGDMFSRCAPAGKFRVVSVDTFDGDDWMEGDFAMIDEARATAAAAAAAKRHSFMVAYVYDSEGRNVSEASEGKG